MFYGLCDLPWWGFIVTLLVTTHITIVCVTVFLHRCQAHRALTLHPAVSHFFRLWLWLTTGMVTKAWTAIHRKHHAKCETIDDPHSPQIMGLPMVLWQGAELYRKEAKSKETLSRYGEGTPDDWLEQHVYTPHSDWGKYVMLTTYLILFGVPGLAMWAIQMAWIPFFAAGVINGVAHYWGYRNFECPDEARNVSPIGILIGGEEMHNNHHTYPTSAKFSVKPWEFDIGWLYIQVLSFFKLAQVKRVPPEPTFSPGKTFVDVETLKAIILNRFQVMATYSKKVIVPVFMQEKSSIQAQGASDPNQVKALLVREQSLLDQSAKQRLAQFLENNKTMGVVYQFKERLQSLWEQSTLREHDLLEALEKWCAEAESTGIAVLKEFAAYLKSFSLKLNSPH